MQKNFEQEKKNEINKYKEAINSKNDRIKELEKNEKRLIGEKDKSESMSK